MSIISTLRRILNDTPGTATNIDYNFQVLEDYVNTSVVTTDGLNGVTGPLPVGTPVAPAHATTKQYVDDKWYPSFIQEYAGDVLPGGGVEGGWDWCRGGVRSSTDPIYARLFGVIQYKYGDAGGGNFKLPDKRGRVSVGFDDAGDTAFSPLGKTNAMSARNAELLSHFHTVPEHGHTAGASVVNTDHLHNQGGTFITSTDGSHDHGINGQLYYVGALGSEFSGSGGSAARTTFLTQGAHNHSVTISGTTGGVRAEYTNAVSHGHTITVNNQLAFNTQNQGAGTTLTDKNLQPYVVTNFIIKL